jgi:hypothetical protein
METKTFVDPRVKQSLARFELVTVNIDHNAALAAQHSVSGIPAFVVLDPDGEEVSKTTGFMATDPFNVWLQDSVTNLTLSAQAIADFQEMTRVATESLASRDAATRVKGLNMVLDCCERHEKAWREFGLQQLHTVASSNPSFLLNGLNHPGLMARIQVANLLREKLGSDFNIDPWETAEVRKHDVEAWKAKVASQSAH